MDKSSTNVRWIELRNQRIFYNMELQEVQIKMHYNKIDKLKTEKILNNE